MTRIPDSSLKTAATFEKLFKRYYAWLCHYVTKLSGDPDLAEDLVQEVFIKLWESRYYITVRTSFKHYLFKACHRRFLQYVREEKKENNLLNTLKWETLYDLQAEGPQHMSVKIQAVRQAIDQLPPKCKEAFLLSRYNQLKYREIAEEMGISIKTVEIHISKALVLLKQNISFPLYLFILIFQEFLN
ncbi:RNA polymerase sigma-70 factor [Sinomicrobium kalidii]|uniref:RNA polymerase sigma factor n=1 Tax=Sinomicrobium kalidii TaxID=2900738 RepID=UPI001E4CCBB8|nr:RNA polymerase sigma-70 factor [Sinomicrobium kalidii]UGU17422.1 RNA polymerase sigma-70 factor [Sinomicrobium kalidii]